MKCPACAAVVPDGSYECPGCGVNFKKWRAINEAPVPATAVILEKKEVVEKKEAVNVPIMPIILGVLFCAAAAGGYVAYKYVASGSPTTEQVSAQPETEAPLPTAGFDRLYQEYGAKAASLHIGAQEAEARKFFQAGADMIRNMDFAAMQTAGMKDPEKPLNEEERRKILIDGAAEYIEKTYGASEVAAEQARMETVADKILKGGDAAVNSTALLDTYALRFQREGALAEIERMRAR